jgi:hypothetical protein
MYIHAQGFAARHAVWLSSIAVGKAALKRQLYETGTHTLV